MGSSVEKHDQKLQRSANWATIVGTVIAVVATCLACLQLVLQTRVPPEIQAAKTLIAIEQEKQRAQATFSALQTQQVQSDTISNGENLPK